ncbi:MAG: SDR family NAD(P)-dependent oxidoreductase, partial [Deltaproteobacteria bacterium]|nr:SDR family NAD(P)-dependent oxidoreductase [Deltaproteobacteria bacterium]
MKLQDKVALITGASKGIGKGIALRYAQEGATVVLASRSMDLLSMAADEIKSRGGQALALEVDVRSSDSIQIAVDRTVAQFGRLDIMVNNAGISMA